MYKKLILKIAILVIPLTILIVIINIKVDSGFLLNDRSRKIARIFASGRNAGIRYVPSDWGFLQIAIIEERLNQKDTLSKDILVFGTSRSSEISSDIFPQNTFFNCAIPNGNVLDYIALYGLYKRYEMLPKYLIIAIDPWTFHARKSIKTNKEIQAVSDISIPLRVNSDLINDCYTGLKFLELYGTNFKLKKNNNSFNDIAGFFSPNYFQNNIRSIFDSKKNIIETDSINVNSYFVILSDGSYSLAQRSRIDSVSVKDVSYKFVNIHKSKFFISSDTNSIYFGYFKKLLISLKKEGVTPLVYISPVNPILFDNLSDSARVPLEEKIDLFCKENIITRIGSFNPHKYNLNSVSNFFVDGYHPVKSVVENIFYYHKNELMTIGLTTFPDKSHKP